MNNIVLNTREACQLSDIGRFSTNRWLSREEPVEANLRGSELLFCLTLYNESLIDLANTLQSISRAVHYLRENTPEHRRLRVCIICDGDARMDRRVREEVVALGWLPQTLLADNDDDLFVSEVTYKPNHFAWVDSAAGDAAACASFNLSFCVKPKNHGKLDSHWWFFKKLCELYRPTYCFQIDAGTELTPPALNEMVRVFNAEPETAAVASQVLIRSEQPSSMLESHQCADFVIQRSILWAAENLCGYISVVPGQFCGVNWSALASPDADGHAPVDRYLKGIHCETAQEKIMFLAEDRVMGFELLAKKGADCRLTYAGQSECYTDSCNTVDELLKQRRRWVNSAFMCRSWALVNFSRYLSNSSAPLSRKLHVSTSILSMLWSHTLDFFQPLLCLLLMTLTYGSVMQLAVNYGVTKSFAIAVFTGLVVCWLAPTVTALCGGFKRLSKANAERLLVTATAAVSCATVINFVAVEAMLWLVFTSLMLLPSITLLSATILGRQAGYIGWRSMGQYVLSASPMNLMVNAYAFVNMHDASWGTKGLLKANHSAGGVDLDGKLSRFAKRFIAVWLSTNLAIFGGVLFTSSLYGALSAVWLFLVSYFAVGLVGCIAVRLRGLRSQPTRIALDQSV